jgi:hypothetical protein
MKKSRIPLLGFLLVYLIFAACDGHTSVKGYVYDKDENPIKDALVSLEYSDQKFNVHSDKDGVYNVGLVHGPFFASLTLTATKEGYEPFKLSFSSNSSPQGYYKIVLKRVAPSKATSKASFERRIQQALAGDSVERGGCLKVKLRLDGFARR